jgi:hypothetical protein
MLVHIVEIVEANPGKQYRWVHLDDRSRPTGIVSRIVGRDAEQVTVGMIGWISDATADCMEIPCCWP